MKLRICNSCFLPEERRLFSEAFPFITKRLGISGYKGTIEVHDCDDEDIRRSGCVGPDCTPEVIRGIAAGKPLRSFAMQVRRRSLAGMLQTFCHEMIHVKQHLTGVLGVGFDKITHKPIKLYQNVPVGDASGDLIPYRDQPWEKEARAGETPLAVWAAERMLEQRDHRHAA
jgi:hypothetical protein